ncbi:putative peptidyl-prolyl cis-trans isomerse D [Parvularcula bermudensis HTCC2503]|uniref:Putative peptidyl-prolyl cis-trans isomerse D n=1 Tax=Parvularcula bermudensis (strain ATCC BAA-594 / HTCC2503 / KCTC 12087) TaxID=314260 RepID=E0TGS4_PARBH|nr:peptidylprolyl isomerase [Parvularcula bermudensis]ADM10683.1 putative peptidyl-prolyl cis-trans isomerse D [Parvularcula bermudensis HTCC2503]
MLTTFRKATKGVGAWVVLGLAILAFAFVGVPTLSGSGGQEAIRVGGTVFEVAAVEEEFSRRFQRQQRGENAPASREEAVAAGLLDQVVRDYGLRALILEEADTLGLAVSPEMLTTYLRAQPAFLDEDGEFDSNRFNRVLAANQLSLTELRDRLSLELIEGQLNRAVATGVGAPAILAQSLALRQGEERDVSLVTFSAPEIAAPSEENLRQYYEERQGRYRTGEARGFTYLLLTDDTIGAEIAISDEDVRQLYDARVGSLGTPEIRSLTQAQFRDASAARDALAAIEAGAAFNDAVEAAGGTLATLDGVTESAIADQAVAEAAFAAASPAILGPIDGIFGTVLVNLTQIVPATTPSFEEVREDLEAALRQEDLGQRIDDIYTEIQFAGDDGTPLAEAAQGLDLSAVTISPKPLAALQDDDRLPPALLAAVFTTAPGAYFEEVRLPEGGVAFFELGEIVPSSVQPFEAVEEEVATDWRTDQRIEALRGVREAVMSAIADGQSFADAVAAEGETVSTRTLSANVLNDDLPPALVEAIFSRPIGEVLDALGSDRTDLTLAKVEDVRFIAPSTAPSLAQLRQTLSRDIATDLFEAYLLSAEQDYGIRVNDGLLAERFGTAP